MKRSGWMRRGPIRSKPLGVVDEQLLDSYRNAPCEICGKRPPSEPHHIEARGLGGGNRKDVRSNLVSLCLRHHRETHDGNLLRSVLRAIVAYRGD